MQAENWKIVKEILRDVLQLAPSERREFLEKTIAPVEIRAEVESLLACEAESEDFMSLPITDFSKDFMAAENDEEEISLAGRKIGIYEIVKEIGFGGMGAVYLAIRADGKFEQQVAIKMLKREYNHEKIRRHFRREREIQARLNHPNIARLLDAGSCADGVPFLVMEYIEGVPIDKFCESKNLGLNARLKLFNRVCDAVMHAHRNLIVHRDLKPSNILVNDEGEPKLLDFGISKMLGAESNDNHTITNLGAMTPQYASPEQIKGETVTTATDIYSLGVVLYKLLTGGFPYNFTNKSNENLLKEITDSAPRRPSVAVTLTFEKSNPKSQSLNPKSLSGDLDNIILKSLCKEPERRYQTVEQFSADIWRYIDGLPVLARPATFSYQASKFYQRNKISVLAGIFILVSLLTGLTVALWQTNVARGQARFAADAQNLAEIEAENAKTEEEKAKAEKAKAEKISQFTMKIISYANPAWFAEGAKFHGETRVIDVMDELGEKIDTEFAGQPDVQAELHHKFSEVYIFVSQREDNPARAESYRQKRKFHALRALELRKQFYGERHELVAKDIAYACVFLGKDDREQAEWLTRAIQMMRETNPKNLNLPYMLEAYANRLSTAEQPQMQEPYRQSVLPPTNLGKYEIAEKYYEEMLELFHFHYADEHFTIALTNCYLALIKARQNKFAEAQPNYQICREAEKRFEFESQSKMIKSLLDKIEAITADNSR